MTRAAEVIVVGLGAMGTATLYQLARRGVRAIGIDRFSPPHDRGSSHGETRVTRQAIGEGEVYVPFALRSHAIWRELEAETGAELLLACGFVAIDGAGGAGSLHHKPGFVARTVAAARRFGIAHEIISAGELARRHPAFRPRGDEQVYYEPGGGLVFPERCLAAQLDRARALGAIIRTGETVSAVEQRTATVRVRTDMAELEADRVVIAAGGWTPELLGGALGQARLLRQVLHWFPPAAPGEYAPGRFPSFIWSHGAADEDSFYGFPTVPGMTPGVKLATEQYAAAITDPESLQRTVDPEEAKAMHALHARGRLGGLGSTAIRSTACFYTNLPDGDFVIDQLPESDRVLVVSACSGHGFKHSAGVGEHIARFLVGDGGLDPAFRFRCRSADAPFSAPPAPGSPENPPVR